jgi:hypothetical protein
MTSTFSRVLRIAYPATIALAAATLAWTNSVQGNNSTTSKNHLSPDPDFSFQRTLASADTSCSLKDRFRLTHSQSCPDGWEQWSIFGDDKNETFASQKNSVNTTTPN